jgi:hypothetical protein
MEKFVLFGKYLLGYGWKSLYFFVRLAVLGVIGLSWRARYSLTFVFWMTRLALQTQTCKLEPFSTGTDSQKKYSFSLHSRPRAASRREAPVRYEKKRTLFRSSRRSRSDRVVLTWNINVRKVITMCESVQDIIDYSLNPNTKKQVSSFCIFSKCCILKVSLFVVWRMLAKLFQTLWETWQGGSLYQYWGLS